MFITALFMIARTWKQPRCSSADEWIRKLWYIYKMEHSVQFSSVARLFAAPWIAARQASLSITNAWSSLKTHVHRVGVAIQPSHPLSSTSPPAPKPSQHQNYSTIKKNEIMFFATTWMDPEMIILSEISQTKKKTIIYHLYMESKIWHAC